MTENKRFRISQGYTDRFCHDWQNNQLLNFRETIELLNEQHEQIQELIQSSKELEEDCQSTFNAMSRKQDDLYRKNFKLKEENEQLKGSLYAEKTNTAEVINDYSKQFKRHSKEFSFMIDLAEDLGVDVSELEAKDD